jgi:subtilase family serine protease
MEADFDNYACGQGQCAGTWAGTSFTAPRWAGFMALINQQAQSAGDPPIGFLNPTLYSIAEGANANLKLHDITTGNNDYLKKPHQPSFYAIPDYDLVTGWGSPNGQNLIDVLAPPSTSIGFQLSDSPNVLTVTPAASAKINISVHGADGFNGTVNFAISGLPPSVTASFAPTSSATSSVLTLAAPTNILGGTYFPQISGKSGALQATTNC